MTTRLTLVALLTATAGCGAGSVAISDRVTGLFGGADAVDVVQTPIQVYAYRLASPSYFHKSVDDFEMAAGPVSVSSEHIAELSTILLDDGSYGWDSAKGCEPDYGVRLQIKRGENTVDVLLCFECEILTIYFNGQSVGGEDFDDVQPQLARIAKALFPDDEAIQAMD